MLFPLKNIEAHVDDKFLIIGETLYEQGKVSELGEAERHLWLATVVGHEVEVQITPSKVRAYTCECNNYEKQGCCEHITAVLLKLRRELDKLKSKKASGKTKRNTVAKKLTTAVILENISPQELKAFVKDFAKSNRTFSLALKARFAAAVPMADNREKYFQLLETTIKGARTRNDRIRYKGKLKLEKILKELLAQTDDYIVTKNFTDAFYILQAVIEKGAPLYYKIEGKSEKYFDLIKRAFTLLRQLLQSDIAPAMTEDIRAFCAEECGKSIYRFGGFNLDFLDILSETAQTAEQQSELLQIIDLQIKGSSSSSKYRADLLVYKLNLLEKTGQSEEAEKLVFENLGEPQLLLTVIEAALAAENYPRVRFLAERGIENDFPKEKQVRIESALFDTAIAEKNAEEIKKYGQSRLLREKKTEDFKLLKSTIDPQEWSAFITEVLEDLHRQSYSFEKRDILAAIYAEEGQLRQLIDYIESIRSLDLLQRYDELLIKEDKERVYKLYYEILNSFIRHHLGRKSSEKIRSALQHLKRIGAVKLAAELTDKFRNAYPERFTLIEELGKI